MSRIVVDLDEREQEVRGEREQLLLQRALSSLDAVADGDGVVRARVQEIGARVAALDEELALLSFAREESERRAQEAAEAARAAEQERRRAEAERLALKRDDAVREALAAAQELARRVRSVFDADDAALALSGRGSAVGAGIRDGFTERVLVELQDAGARLARPVLAAQRARLLELWPAAAPTAREAGQGDSARCSVCARDDREEIDVALTEGIPLRVLEERFGLSRSSLSRHRQHAQTLAA